MKKAEEANKRDNSKTNGYRGVGMERHRDSVEHKKFGRIPMLWDGAQASEIASWATTPTTKMCLTAGRIELIDSIPLHSSISL